MTEQAVDSFMSRVLLDVIRLECDNSAYEQMEFAPSQCNREQMQKMRGNPFAWAKNKQSRLFENNN